MQVDIAAEEVRRREVTVAEQEARAAAALEEVSAREAAAKASAAEMVKLEKQLSARKLEAQELQVRCGRALPYAKHPSLHLIESSCRRWCQGLAQESRF